MSGSEAGGLVYLDRIPRKPPPPGRLVAHNHVRPLDFHSRYRLGLNGFRAWTDDADDARYVRCPCEWADGQLAEHYRVRR
jgi:hypothetical protein